MEWPEAGATRAVGVIAAAVAAFAVYANSLQNEFVYDDRPVVLANPTLRDATDWRAILFTPSWAPRAELAVAYRPLSTWTLAVDRALHGDEPWGYHLANVVLHAGNATLVVVFAGTLGLSPPTAALAGVLFAVHPIHGEAVANVVGRAELLAALFAMLMLCGHRRATERGFPVRISLAVVGCYALALLAKEHAVALALCVPLLDLLMIDGGSPTRFARALLGRRGLLYGALTLVTAGYLVLRQAALGVLVGPPDTIAFWMNPAAHAPPLWRILTALGVAARAAGLLLLPIRLSADYSFRQIEVVSAVVDPWALAGLGFVMLCVIALVWSWRRSARAFACLVLALATFGVVSNVLVPTGTIFGERLLYLPSIGACILLAMAAAGAARRWRAVTALAGAGVVLSWASITWARNVIWRDQTRFAEALVMEAPRSAHAHHVLGTTYATLGRHEEALVELDRALAIDPTNAGSLFNAAVIFRERGETAEAIARLRRATEVGPTHLPAWLTLSLLYAADGRFDEALAAADHAVVLRPGRADTHVTRGIALRGLGRLDEARGSVERGLDLRPDEPRALAERAQIALAQRDLVAADAALARLVTVAPSPRAYATVLRAYEEAGRRREAERLIARGSVAARGPR